MAITKRTNVFLVKKLKPPAGVSAARFFKFLFCIGTDATYKVPYSLALAGHTQMNWL